jgi:hypothetical protein
MEITEFPRHFDILIDLDIWSYLGISSDIIAKGG